MNCKNCGAVLSPNSTICSMCGAPANVQMNQVNGDVKPEILDLTSNENNANILPNVSNQLEITNIVNDNVPSTNNTEIPIVQISEPVAQTQNVDVKDNVSQIENTNNMIINENKKSSDTVFYILIGVISFAIVAAVVYLLFFTNK